MKKTNKYTALYLSLGMALGLCFGMTVWGIVFHSIGVGMCLGIAFGMIFGNALGAAKDAKINKQLEDFGYRVMSVNKTPDGYDVIITDKNGSENAVSVSEKTLSKEKFKPGDLVYLDGERIEQAY